MRYCKHCDKLIDFDETICHYCGNGPTKPRAPKRSVSGGAIIAMVLAVLLFASIAVVAITRSLVHWEWEDDWVAWEYDSHWAYTSVVTWFLLDAPELYFRQSIALTLTIDEALVLDANESVYGTVFVHPVTLFYAHDEMGAALVVVPWDTSDEIMPGDTLRFNAVFMRLADVQGEQRPLIQAHAWE